jgi:hypothetical protein
MLFGLLGGAETFEETDVRLLRFDRPDAPGNELATAHLRITVKDQDEKKVGRAFSDAAFSLALGGYAGFHTTTPPTPASAFGVYWPALVPAGVVAQQVHLPDGTSLDIPHTCSPDSAAAGSPGPPARASQAESGVGQAESGVGQAESAGHSGRPAAVVQGPAVVPGPTARIPLGRLCGARSGDKGGNANVGLWAVSAPAYDWLRQFLTTERFRELLTEASALEVDRYELPNLLALNFVVHGILAPGVSGTARPDPQAKGLGEYLRSRVVTAPSALIST